MTQSEDATGSQIEARLELALLRSPRQFTELESALLRQRVERAIHLQRALRTAHLENGDEPSAEFDPAPFGRSDTKENQA